MSAAAPRSLGQHVLVPSGCVAASQKPPPRRRALGPGKGRNRNRKSSAVLHPASEAEAETFLKNEGLTVVDWFATWCGPCRKTASYYGKLAHRHASARFLKLDVEKFAELSERHKIEAVPTFILFKNGAEVARIEGAATPELKAALETHASK